MSLVSSGSFALGTVHAGVAGNARADMLAGKAVVGEPISLDHPTVNATLTYS